MRVRNRGSTKTRAKRARKASDFFALDATVSVMDGFELKMATEADAMELIEVHHNAVRVLAAAFYPSDVIDAWTPAPNPERRAAYQKRIASGKEVTVVASRGKGIIGFGAIVPELNELRAVYVSPDAVRRGVGTAILRRLEELARERGLPELQLVSSLSMPSAFISRTGMCPRGEASILYEMA